MGCLHSKKEAVDLHPNVFRVVNIDENGADLCSGQLEITETDIILYREGRDSTIWPLHSLRRYGFEQDIFSFESGRRCETGEGIYAFRCRRAAFLFQNLQQQIQLRNVINDPVAYPVTRLTNSPSPRGRQTLQASVVHRSSLDNGRPDLVSQNNNQPPVAPRPVPNSVTQSPRSPSSADILEVMPLYPRSQTSSNNHVSNIYQLNDFKREHNNNHSEVNTHIYSNDITRDLAVLRNTLKQEAVFNNIRDIEEESRFLESRYVNETIPKNINLVSPTLSNSSEHYSQLNTAQKENSRMYMNIALNETLPEMNKNDATPTTPMTPKLVEYCNINMSGKTDIINSYANLSIGDVIDTKNAQSSEPHHKFSESDTITSMSPVEELEVNYAVLDIETKETSTKVTRELGSPENQSYNSSKTESLASSSSHIKGKFVSQTSLEKPSTLSTPSAPPGVGYTTIDFEKTVALTSVASNTDMDSEGSRKTRHNSVNIVFGSPSIADKKLHLNN